MNENFIQDIYTEDELWEKSKVGDISVLKDKNVFLLKNRINETPLHGLAGNKKIEILNYPEVATLKNDYGNTPLHYLAVAGRVEILSHPEVSKVKNIYESTPLHYLARKGKIEVLYHHDVAKVKDNWGNTPLHNLVIRINVPKESIQKLFPWYPFKKDEIIDEYLITKILATPQSIRFIYE